MPAPSDRVLDRRAIVAAAGTTERRDWSWLEGSVVVALAFLATLRTEWRIISEPFVFQGDAQIHEYWMRRFQDGALFQDTLTNALLSTGYSPPGFRFLFWSASHAVDPVHFGELLPLLLQPLAVWLVFRIIRSHSDWRPAAWIGAALFLVPSDVLRFSGGHPRAFADPIVLLAVFFLLGRRNLRAALVPPVGVLLYPPAGLVALGIVALSSLERGQRAFVNVRRAAWAGASTAGVAAALLLPRLVAATSDGLISEAEARRYPEFGPEGPMHYFSSSTLDYLRNNYSGFFLQDAGSILAVAALLLLILRPRNALLLRWEVWCMAISALGFFAVAQAVLFQLYLPHRYTYALLPFFCIVIAAAVRPTFGALAARARSFSLAAPVLALAVALLALGFFPLGPRRSLSGLGSWLVDATPYLAVGFGVGVVLAAGILKRTAGRAASASSVAATAAAIVASSVVVAEVAFAGSFAVMRGNLCPYTRLYGYLQTLPKNAIIAGDPVDLNCIPIAARRPVVISRKLYQPWNPQYFQLIRERMFRDVRAQYGSSTEALVDLRTRYGADYVLVRNQPRKHVWPARMAPFTGELARFLELVPVAASQRLPQGCQTWRGGKFRVYSLACVAAGRLA